MDFLEWFLDLPYEHKIFIAGNHDFCLHGTGIEGLPEGCHFLNYCGVTIDGVKFYGVPYSVADYRSGRYHDEIENIPEDVQVLVTHHRHTEFWMYVMSGILEIRTCCRKSCA